MVKPGYLLNYIATLEKTKKLKVHFDVKPKRLVIFRRCNSYLATKLSEASSRNMLAIKYDQERDSSINKIQTSLAQYI